MLVKTEKPEFSDEVLQDNIKNPAWRICNLYKIINKDSQIVTFRPNAAQRYFYSNMATLNAILKARQLGFSTAIDIFMLDRCLFTPATSACIIAQKLNMATQIFASKVKFPYDRLPPALKTMVAHNKDNSQMLVFNNDSQISVDVSWRGGTLNLLHVSEYGKICATDPAHEREIKTGAIPTVSLTNPTNMVALESTAEGKTGHFWEVCRDSWDKDWSRLSPMDWKFFFFPWWKQPEYAMNHEVAIPEYLQDYFERLEVEHHIKLTVEQRWWYVKFAETQGDDMKREMPSFKEESFNQAVEGAFFAHQLRNIDKNSQITKVPYRPDYPVYTFWDLGKRDCTSIWFMQEIKGRFRFIRYYENSEEDPSHYMVKLQEFGYAYKAHFMPHDADNDVLQGSIRHHFEQIGLRNIKTGDRVAQKIAAIDRARLVLPNCWFDEANCARGLDCLRSYRKKVKGDGEIMHDRPEHDWASHGADAFMEFAINYKPVHAPTPLQYRNLDCYA